MVRTLPGPFEQSEATSSAVAVSAAPVSVAAAAAPCGPADELKAFANENRGHERTSVGVAARLAAGDDLRLTEEPEL